MNHEQYSVQSSVVSFKNSLTNHHSATAKGLLRLGRIPGGGQATTGGWNVDDPKLMGGVKLYNSEFRFLTKKSNDFVGF